jgi:Tfp pilus assembly protein PilF
MTEARSLEEQGKIESAVTLYSQIVEEDSRRADAYHRLAVLHDMKGDFRKSAEFYEAALEQQPDNPQLHCDLGYSYYLQRRWQDAERAFRVAILLKPEHARTHNNLGLLLAHTGRNTEALEEFGRAGCPQSDAEANLSTALAWARVQRTPSDEQGAALATQSRPRRGEEGSLSDPPSTRIASSGSSHAH